MIQKLCADAHLRNTQINFLTVLADCASMRCMHSFRDFCAWVGSQRKAAKKLGVDESTVSRACKVGPSLDLAREAERVSEGRFRAAVMLGLVQGPSQMATQGETHAS